MYVQRWAGAIGVRRARPPCCAEAQRLAQQFSNAEFIKKILPENGLLEALKKVVPMALKIVA